MPILQTVQEGLVAVPQQGKEQSCLENSQVASSLSGLNPGPVSQVLPLLGLGYPSSPSRPHAPVTDSHQGCWSSLPRKEQGICSSWAELIAQSCLHIDSRVHPDCLLQDQPTDPLSLGAAMWPVLTDGLDVQLQVCPT